MAYNLPNQEATGLGPMLKGFTTGSNFYRQLVQNAAQRAAMKHAEEQSARAEKLLPYTLKHMLGMESRANSANSRNAQARAEAHQKYMNEQNPDYAANKFMHEMQILGNMGGENSTSQNASERPTEQFNALREMMKSKAMPQGQGAMMPHPDEQEQPQMMGVEQQGAQPHPIQQDIDWNNLNPVQKMWAAKHGFKMNQSESPEQKMQHQMELFKLKEQYKAENATDNPAAIKTLHQNIIQLSPKAIKAIDHIIEIPSPTEVPGLGFVKSGQKAAHNKSVTAAAENYAKANGWPNTKGSIEKAESILQRGSWETDHDYHARLRGLQEELRNGIIVSEEFLHPGSQLTQSTMSNDPLGIR